MAEVIKRNKALSVSPLKASSTLGAALAFLGIRGAIPMLHGAQGCTAYGKIFLIGHFREPVPLQTTAMDQVSTVMGADDNVVEGLKTICEKLSPALIGVPTTGLAETEGSDTAGAVNVFRSTYPQYAGTAIVPVETPDYAGSLESGFAKAVTAMIDRLVPPAPEKKRGPVTPQVNVLVGASLSPADIEEITTLIEAFDLEPLFVPDISGGLDGHLEAEDFVPLTTGGMGVEDFAGLHHARATLVIGGSLAGAADLLGARTHVPDYRFDHLMGLGAVDRFVQALHKISGNPVPARLKRQRAQLQDAMLDTHFNIGLARIAIAADPDLLVAYGDLLTGMGAQLVAAVAPSNARSLGRLVAEQVKIGDLQDLELLAGGGQAALVIGNSHCAGVAARLGLPLLRAGFPQYDRFGAAAELSSGYRGTRRILFDLANLLAEAEAEATAPYRSVYRQEALEPAQDNRQAEQAHGA